MSGTLDHSPAEIVANAIIDDGLGVEPIKTGSWPVYATRMGDTPDNAISVQDTAGRINGREHIAGETQKHHGVQVLVRSDVWQTGYRKAIAIAQFFDLTVLRTTVYIGSDSYDIQSISMVGDIIPIPSVKGERRRLFSINALASIRQNAGTGS